MIYLIRHAQSCMNLAKQEQAAAIAAGNAKVVWDRKLCDAAITALGHEQVKSARAAAHQLKVSHVYVSPLFRALQTCSGLFSGHPLSPAVHVLPQAAEIISDAGDISLGNLAHQSNFPAYDWSRVAEIRSKYWMETVSDSERIKKAVETSADTEEVIGKLCAELAKCYPEHLETKPDALRRVQFMSSLLEGHREKGESVAIVGHRDVLRSLMRLYLSPGSEFLLENCQIFPLPKAKASSHT